MESKLPVSGTGKHLRTIEQSTAAGTVHTEAVALADPVNPQEVARVVDGAVVVTQAAQPLQYVSTTLSAGQLSVPGKLMAFRVFASLTDGSFRINGGDAITVRAGTGFDRQVQGQSDNATIEWVSGTLDVYAEYG